MNKILAFGFALLISAFAQAHELVMNHDFPDPTLIKAYDGWYYAYATQGVTEEANPRLLNIQVARSKDLRNWQHLGEALPEKPTWANKTQAFWAPHIHFAYNRYYLYYSADSNAKNGLCLAVAVSRKPQGPFVDSGRPMVCGPSFSNIDPMVFNDPQTGRPLLYWGSGFDPVRVRPLSASLLSFQPNTRTLPLLAPIKTPDAPPFSKLLEGAWVIQQGGFFYLFVSGENCCEGNDPQYAVLVARSENSVGPFKWKNDDIKQSVVTRASAPFIATGHNALIHDPSGQLWSFYHGIDTRKPMLAHPIPGDRVVRRVLLRTRINFVDGWPVAN